MVVGISVLMLLGILFTVVQTLMLQGNAVCTVVYMSSVWPTCTKMSKAIKFRTCSHMGRQWTSGHNTQPSTAVGVGGEFCANFY